MIREGDRVKHTDSEIDKLRGVMTVLAIKNGIALCGYTDYERLGSGQWNYPLTELKIA